MDETSAGPGAVRLVHDTDRDRYEALDRDSDVVVAVLQYGDDEQTSDGGAPSTVRDLRSTVVAPDRSGRGVGSAVVRFALDDAREQGLKVRATCWFVRGWIERHPDYAALLDPGPAAPASEEER